jgi:aminoglycoside phosphotransferase (APT) family kinase protein
MPRAETPTEQQRLAAQYQKEARDPAADFVRSEPTAVRRFATGAGHYVFEATFADHAPLVVRITRPRYRTLCKDAAQLSTLLRPLGVPLPQLLEDGSSAPLPYLLLERLPGKDLWEVLNGLSPEAFERIAARVAEAQSIVAATPTAGRYGYAASPGRAPLLTWAEVLDANLHQSRGRIETAGLFDGEAISVAAALVDKLRDQLNSMPATPFLHDTTTKNVIVAEDGAFSGIVDVDDLCFGDPRYVIALTYTAVLNQRGPVAYVRHWLDRAGYKKDGLFWLYVAVFLVDFMSEHGQQFNGNQRPSSKEQRQHLIDLFADTVPRVH